MTLEELWIGDFVQILSSGKKGKFIGVSKDGRARVDYQSKVLLVSARNLVLIEEVEPDTLDLGLDEDSTITPTVKATKFDPKLDLHIESLHPSLHNSQPEHILDYQLRACNDFIKKAIELRVATITIIHGRGSGRLKDEVMHILGNYNEVLMSETGHNGGAQIVLLKQY